MPRRLVTIDTIPVCLISSAQYAPHAEKIVCWLGRGYYFAGGFNMAWAGGSVDSVNAVTEAEWQAMRKHIDIDFGCTRNQEQEFMRRRVYRYKHISEPLKALHDKIDAYNATERELHASYLEMQKGLDKEFWKNDPFLRDYVEDLEVFERFVESRPQ